MPHLNTVITPYRQIEAYQYEYTNINKALEKIQLLVHDKNNNIDTYEIINLLDKLTKEIKIHESQLCDLITTEIGKTANDSKVEIQRAETTIKAIRDARCSMSGDLLESQSYLQGDERMGLVKHAPLGIVLAITPFNFPVNLALHKIIPALAMGNRVLFKPHPQCFRSSELLTNLFYKAGFRKSDIQMICPTNDDMAEIVSHKDIACVSFTGGIHGAKIVSSHAVLKKQLFELGGNDALVVYPGSDYSKAAESVISQRFGCAGQRCTASKRVFVHEECYEVFKEILVEKTKLLVVGDPENTSTFVGPVVSKQSAINIENKIQTAVDQGAIITLGGKRENAIIYPTILENVTSEMEIIKEETFGPVVPLFKFNSTDKLIEQINNSSFGLQCGVFTNDISLCKKLYKSLEIGSLIINEGPGYRADHFPFGGTKSSGIGREGGMYALLEFSQTKTLII